MDWLRRDNDDTRRLGLVTGCKVRIGEVAGCKIHGEVIDAQVVVDDCEKEMDLDCAEKTVQGDQSSGSSHAFVDSTVEDGDAEDKDQLQCDGKKVQGESSSFRRPWTTEDSRLLMKLVDKYGDKNWSEVAKHFNDRTRNQCRQRWSNHLCPEIKKDAWSEEERLFIKAHQRMGNKWVKIAQRIPGRTENSAKNHWNATKRKIERNPEGLSQPSLLVDYISRTLYSNVEEEEDEDDDEVLLQLRL